MLALPIVNTEPLAPSTTSLLKRHSYSIGSLPDATTVNVAVSPSITRACSGCCVIVIGTSTVIEAESLTTVPASLLILTLYPAASVVANASNSSSFALAPSIASPFFDHWYSSGSEPLATTDNVTPWPSNLVALSGCCVIVIGCTTVSFTSSLTALPAGFFITTW